MKYLFLLFLASCQSLFQHQEFAICHEPKDCFEFAHIDCKKIELIMFRDMIINNKTNEQGYYLAYYCEDQK